MRYFRPEGIHKSSSLRAKHSFGPSFGLVALIVYRPQTPPRGKLTCSVQIVLPLEVQHCNSFPSGPTGEPLDIVEACLMAPLARYAR